MRTILLLNASPFGSASRAYGLARKAARNVMNGQSDIRLVERDLSQLRPSPLSELYAHAIVTRAQHDAPAFEESEALIREVEACDYLIVATPMHNFTVPASLKLWIDYVLRAGRTFSYRDGHKVGLLDDRPALVVIGSGGIHKGADAKQPDYLSAYFAHVLATIGIKDVQFIHLQGLSRPDIVEQSLLLGERQLADDPVFGLTSEMASA
jgi:FMN-dependent NADH-azoreductase